MRCDMNCPAVGKGRENWCRAWCVERVKVDNPCTHRCKVGIEIREELGMKPWVPPKRIIYAPNQWGHWSKWERNRDIAVSVLKGQSRIVVAKRWGVSLARVSSVTKNICRAANPDGYEKLFNHGFKIKKFKTDIRNRELFLPNIPKEYPYVRKEDRRILGEESA